MGKRLAAEAVIDELLRQQAGTPERTGLARVEPPPSALGELMTAGPR